MIHDPVDSRMDPKISTKTSLLKSGTDIIIISNVLPCPFSKFYPLSLCLPATYHGNEPDRKI